MQASTLFNNATHQIMSSPWDARIDAEHRRMKQGLATLVAANSSLVDLGPDPLVDQLLSSAGFDRRQAFAIRMLISRGENRSPQSVASRTAIVASSRLWHRTFDRSLLFNIKTQASNNHVQCILVPQRVLAGAVRASTGKVIAQCRHLRPSASDRLRVISYLHDLGGFSELVDCAALIRHADPAGIVLSMVASGDLSIDRAKRIGPHSRISCNI